MPWTFNPFSGTFDQKGSSGGGSVLEGEVATFADLPQTTGTPPVGSSYLVRESTGVWLVNRRQAGIYIRTNNTGVRADDWSYGGDFPVQSVNTLTGAVMLDAADVDAAPDLMPAVYVLASTDPAYAPLSGYYYRSDTAVGGKAAYYKIGSRENTSITYNSATDEWFIKHNAASIWSSMDDPAPSQPWEVQSWAAYGGDPSITVSQADTVLFTNAVAQKASGVSTWSDLASKPSTFAPSAHTHGNLTNAGAIGTTANLPVKTGTNGVIEAGAFGTAAGSFCEGNDARLSDARTPAAHDHLSYTEIQQAIQDDSSAAFGDIVGGIVAQAFDSSGTVVGRLTNGQPANFSLSDFAESGSITTSGLTQSTARLLGRTTASTGAVEEIQIGAGLSLSAGELSATASGGSKTYAVFTAEHNQPPASAYATLDTRNSVAVLDFDDASTESAVFVGIMPEAASLGSGLIVNLDFMATTATSGNVRWSVAFERCTTDLDSDSFDTATAATVAVASTSGVVAVGSVTCTAIDGITAGDLFRLRVQRLGGDAADTASGDIELVAVELRSAA